MGNHIIDVVFILTAGGVALTELVIDLSKSGDEAWSTKHIIELVCICVAVALFLILLVLYKLNDGLYSKLLMPFAFVSLAIYIAMVGMMTFVEPFAGVSNGFFGIWLACLFSFFLCCKVQSKMGSLFKGKGLHLFLLFVFSFVNFCQLIFVVKDDYLIPLICACIGLGLSIVLFVLLQVNASTLDKILGVCSIILVCTWALGAGWDTFNKPFTQGGNGYFSAWFAFAASVLLCADAYGMSTDTGYTVI